MMACGLALAASSQASAATLLAGWNSFSTSGTTTAASSGSYAGSALLNHGDASITTNSLTIDKDSTSHPTVSLAGLGLTSGSFTIAMTISGVEKTTNSEGQVDNLWSVKGSHNYQLGAGVSTDTTDMTQATLGAQYNGGNQVNITGGGTVDLMNQVTLVMQFDASTKTFNFYTTTSDITQVADYKAWENFTLVGSVTRESASTSGYSELYLGSWSNNNGGRTGYELDSLQIYSGLVPEPATATLGLLGFGSLLLRRRKRA